MSFLAETHVVRAHEERRERRRRRRALAAQDWLSAKLAELFRIDALLEALLESLSVRDAARVAAKVTGLPRDKLYNKALELKA